MSFFYKCFLNLQFCNYFLDLFFNNVDFFFPIYNSVTISFNLLFYLLYVTFIFYLFIFFVTLHFYEMS